MIATLHSIIYSKMLLSLLISFFASLPSHSLPLLFLLLPLNSKSSVTVAKMKPK